MINRSIENTIAIQSATLSHLSKLRVLWLARFSRLGYGVEDLESLFFNLNTECLVATSLGELYGFLMFERSGQEIQLLGLAVAEGCGRQGIGYALVERCMQSAATAAVDDIYFHTQGTNVPARKLFEGIGFKLEGVDGNYPTGEQAVRYRWSATS